MGEEAYDEVVLAGDNGMRLFVRGGYCREEVIIGIGFGDSGKYGPDVIVVVNGAEMKRALRSMVIGKPRRKRCR